MSETIDIMQITESQFLEIKMSEWIICVDDMRQMGIAVMEQMKRHLEEIQSVDDIRYRYFRKCYAGQLMLLESDGESREQLIGRFRFFMEWTLEYYLAVFKEESFVGEMEMLPPEARAAVWLNSMFFREEADEEGRRADLENCATCYPVLRNNIERLQNKA